MKKNKFSKNWIIKQNRDIYVKKSKLEGYRSRAVYKLIEINDKFKLIKNNSLVVDLGAAPGSWSQYISRNFNNSKIISIDLKEIEPIKNSIHIKGDFKEEHLKLKIQKYFEKKADLIICINASPFEINKFEKLLEVLNNVSNLDFNNIRDACFAADKENLNKNFRNKN